MRLAELFSRGERAHGRARGAAERGRQAVGEMAGSLASSRGEGRDRSLGIALGLATVANQADISARLFRASTRDRMIELLEELDVPGIPFQPERSQWVAQDRRVAFAVGVSYEPDWGLAAFWDGSIGVFMSAVTSSVYLESIVKEGVVKAFGVGRTLMKALEATGPTYLYVAVQDVGVGALENGVVMARGPFDLSTAPDWDHLLRELQRAVGFEAPEPEAAA